MGEIEVVINVCYGGFGLSKKAILRVNELLTTEEEVLSEWKIEQRRTEYKVRKALVQTVKEMGKEANGAHSELKIVKIPDDVSYVIDDYDGVETIEEKHRSWS